MNDQILMRVEAMPAFRNERVYDAIVLFFARSSEGGPRLLIATGNVNYHDCVLRDFTRIRGSNCEPFIPDDAGIIAKIVESVGDVLTEELDFAREENVTGELKNFRGSGVDITWELFWSWVDRTLDGNEN